jgi:hypothetical protein
MTPVQTERPSRESLAGRREGPESHRQVNTVRSLFIKTGRYIPFSNENMESKALKITEKGLICQALKGDQRAFEALFRG